MATAAQLKALRKKYGLGEYKKSKSKAKMDVPRPTREPRPAPGSSLSTKQIRPQGVAVTDVLAPQRPIDRFGGLCVRETAVV